MILLPSLCLDLMCTMTTQMYQILLVLPGRKQVGSLNRSNDIFSASTSFIVKQPKLFTSYIMPKYFRQTKLTSFQRQLNLYGFRRITQGPDSGAYYQEMFLRRRPKLCMRMNRQKVKGTGHKQPTDVTTEPNFYAMPYQSSKQLFNSL